MGHRLISKYVIKSTSLKELHAIPKNELQQWFRDWNTHQYMCTIYNGRYFEPG